MAAAAARAAPGGEGEEEEERDDDDKAIGGEIEGSPPASPFSSDDAETRNGIERDRADFTAIRIERYRGPEVAGEDDNDDVDFAPTAAAAREQRGGLARAVCFDAVFARARRSEQQQLGEDVEAASAGHRDSADARRRTRSIIF